MLHTAIFYEPNFHKEKKYPFSKFKHLENDDFFVSDGCNFVEIFYFFRNTKYEGMETEVLHYAVWRRTLTDIDKIEETIKEIEEKYYRLVEPKVKETTITILQIETVNQATRAAISQVMARNTSHNIGAHVMNKLTSASFLEKFCSYAYCLKSYKPDKDFEDTKEHRAFDQISIFNNYVKCRMDYLADISFGTPLMQTNKYAYGELFTELDKVRLLLEHISGLSDFKYKIEFRKNGKRFKASKIDDDDKEASEDDLLVAIPNDILGTQAFYNILENIIRNTAKHSSLKPDITIFTVNFIDTLPSKEQMDFCECKNSEKCVCGKPTPTEIENILKDFVAVEVYDNIPVVGTVSELSGEDKREYKEIMGKELKPFAEKIDEIVFAQNKKLNEDILHENKLRSYSLGLVEMDASAAYLRKRPVEYINNPSYNIQFDESWSRDTELNGGNQEIRGINCRHFLKAFKTKAEFEVTIIGDEKIEEIKKGSALGYRLFLHRPAVVLVVTELLKDDKEKKEKLKKEGIWVIAPKEFEKDLKDGKVFPHEFVVIDGKIQFNKIDEVEFLEYYKTSLPLRVFKVEQNEFQNLFEKEDNISNDWEQFCWNKCVTNLIPILGGYVSTFPHQAVFLNHLYSEKSEQTPKKMWEESLKADHLEALSSLAQSKLPDFNKHTKSEVGTEHILKIYLERITTPTDESINGEYVTTRENAYFKIIEAVQKKVIVIDERIQNTTKESKDGGKEFMTIPYKDLYAKMGVIVPDKSLNLSENSFETIKSSLEKYIENEINCAKSTDFILIHYSILERMYEKDEIKTKIEKWAKSINVVVTSGRGIPNNLSENVRFINLSSVITAFVDVRSKYAINYLLNSSRKSNKI